MITKFSRKNRDTGQSKQMVTHYKYSNMYIFFMRTFRNWEAHYVGEIWDTGRTWMIQHTKHCMIHFLHSILSEFLSHKNKLLYSVELGTEHWANWLAWSSYSPLRLSKQFIPETKRNTYKNTQSPSIEKLTIYSIMIINPLQTKRRLLYLKTQSVPRCKHFSSRL